MQDESRTRSWIPPLRGVPPGAIRRRAATASGGAEVPRERITPRASSERKMNLALHMAAAGGDGLNVDEIAAVMGFKHLNRIAVRRQIERDTSEMKVVGLDCQFTGPSDSGSWVMHVSEPGTPPARRVMDSGTVRAMSTRELLARYVKILWDLESGGGRMEESEVARRCVLTEEDLPGILLNMNMFCCGDLPHEYLDLRRHRGLVRLSGPRLYVKKRRV